MLVVRRLGWCLLPAFLGALAALILLLAAAGPARLAYASTLTYPGACGATIQQCIDGANPGDTILISAGDYTESLTLSKAVSLTGALSSTTVLHAPPNTRVLTVTGAAVNSSVVISGLTFTGGSLTDTSGCPRGCGGGVLITATAQPLLINLIFSNNTAGSRGGGVYADTNSPLVMSGVAVNSNASGSRGGGVFASGAATLTNSSFANNTAGDGGGGLYIAAGTLVGVTFLGNSAAVEGGGAVICCGSGGQPTQLVNNLLAGNRAGNRGAGLLLDLSGGSAVILQTTFADAGLAPGAAVYVKSGDVGITDTIIASHTVAIEQGGGTVLQDYNLFFDNGANVSGTVNGGDKSHIGNPAFVNAAGQDYHLGNYSAAIDIGIDAGVATDFEGDPRPQGGEFDIGFDESPYTATADVSVQKIVSAASLQPGQALTYTLIYTNAGPFIASVILTDTVPGNLISVSYTSSGANLTPVGLSVYVWRAADLAPGAGGVITVTGVLSGGVAGSVFTNTVTFKASIPDTNLANNASAVSVTVANAPPIAADDTYIMAAETVLTVTAPGVLGNDFDANSDALTAALAAGPLIGTLDLRATGAFTYTPPLGFAGSVSFTYQANDALVGSNTARVTITVRPLTNIGVVKSTSASLLAPGQRLTYTLVLSNAGPWLATGVRLTDIVPANLINVSYFTSGVALTPVGFQHYDWQVSDLPPGAGGVVTVTGILSGGLAGSVFTNTAMITTTDIDTDPTNNISAAAVTVANAAPAAASDTYSVPAGSNLSVPAPGVLGNDTDANNDPLTAALVAGPLSGTLDLRTTGAFTYTPPPGFTGVVTFTYKANDGLANSNTAPVTITVTPLANVGLIKSASAGLVAPGQRLTYTLVYSNAGPYLATGILVTDVVPSNLVGVSYFSSGAVLTPTGITHYAWQVANLAPGSGGLITVTGVLSGGAHGTVFTNTARIATTTPDTNPANNSSVVSVKVANVPPAAVGDAYTLSVNSSLTVTAPGILRNDSDGNTDVLTAVLLANPLTGTLTLHPDGSFSYTPPHDFVGVVTFTYRANDGLANSNIATVMITMRAIGFKLYLPLVKR